MTKPRSDRRDSPVVNLRGAFIRRTDFSDSNLRGADLTRVDAVGALFRNSDFRDARLDGMNLSGADLTGAKNLTVEQLSQAVIDAQTRLPSYIDRARLPESAGAHQETAP